MQGVVYKVSCLICLESDRKTDYIGESARTAFDRGGEHWAAIRRGDQSNPMVEHMSDHHPEEEARFQMRVVSLHKSPLVRQSEEGRMIDSYKGDMQLKRKGEWGNNLSPNLMVEEVGGPKRKGRQETQQAKRLKGGRETEVSEVAQEGASAPKIQIKEAEERVAGKRSGAATEMEAEQVRVEDVAGQPAVSQVVTGQAQESRRQNYEQKGEKSKVPDGTGVRRASRQLKLKDMLRRLGQEGRRRVEGGKEISLEKESRKGQGQQEYQTGAKVDNNTDSEEYRNFGDPESSDLVRPNVTKYSRSVGSDNSESKNKLGKVHNSEVYIRDQIPSKEHKLTEIRSEIVEIVDSRTSDEDGGRRRSRSQPGAQGNMSTNRKC